LDLATLVPGGGAWEVELGFGKGRYLLARAAAEPERRFLGVEMASKYYRLSRHRARRRSLGNLLLVRGEALYCLASVLPRRFADAVHIYFPDPWPKVRHERRRLLDCHSVDLVLGLLAAGGKLFFATDSAPYAEAVEELLLGYSALDVGRSDGPWEDGARTNYEAKYLKQGRRIFRLVVGSADRAVGLHPDGRCGVLVAPRSSRVEMAGT
jgi:tRNA (guanine-N7-)-methyltransferase